MFLVSHLGPELGIGQCLGTALEAVRGIVGTAITCVNNKKHLCYAFRTNAENMVDDAGYR